MCNDYELHVTWAQYKRALEVVSATIPPRQSELDLPRADDVRINDIAPVMRAPLTSKGGAGVVELAPMRFGFPPPRPKASPVFNFRSEGRRFGESKRCLIPASAFFEFTGTRYPKAKHRFALNDAPFMAIAGLWRDGEGNQPPSFTMLTTEPGPDVCIGSLAPALGPARAGVGTGPPPARGENDTPRRAVVLILFLTNPDRSGMNRSS